MKAITNRATRELAALLAACLVVHATAHAQQAKVDAGVKSPDDTAGASDTDLAKKIQNPIGDLYSFPFQSNTNFGVGPRGGTQEILNIQPVIPIHITPDWNIITRTILPLVWSPDLSPAPSVPFGIGPTTFSAFLSPAKPTNGWLWGVVGRFGGYGLFLSKGEAGFDRGRIVFMYNLLDLKRTMWEGPELEPGRHTIVFEWTPEAPGLGKGGTGVLTVDGKEAARNTMDHSTPITFPEDETFDVGLDTRTGVALLEYRYDPPFKFTGKIDRLTFELGPDLASEAKK